MPNALRGIVILGVLSVLDAMVFVPVFATAQAVRPTGKTCCFLEDGQPTCGQLTAANCSKHTQGQRCSATESCAHNPCLPNGACMYSPTATTTTAAATTTTAPATTTTQAATTTTAAATTTTAAATTTTAAATTTTTAAATTTTAAATTTPTAATTTTAAPTTTTTSTSSTTTTTMGCAPILSSVPGIAGTYNTLTTTDPNVKFCTTAAPAANRFQSCTTEENCGGTTGSTNF